MSEPLARVTVWLNVFQATMPAREKMKYGMPGGAGSPATEPNTNERIPAASSGWSTTHVTPSAVWRYRSVTSRAVRRTSSSRNDHSSRGCTGSHDRLGRIVSNGFGRGAAKGSGAGSGTDGVMTVRAYARATPRPVPGSADLGDRRTAGEEVGAGGEVHHVGLGQVDAVEPRGAGADDGWRPLGAVGGAVQRTRGDRFLRRDLPGERVAHQHEGGPDQQPEVQAEGPLLDVAEV